MFWESLGDLYAARGLVPGFDTPQGAEVIFWLVKSEGRPPLKDLYRSSQFSEPTLRAYLMRLVDQGFATVKGAEGDLRRRSACPTQKLLEALGGYRELVLKVATAAEVEPDTSACAVISGPRNADSSTAASARQHPAPSTTMQVAPSTRQLVARPLIPGQ